MAVKKSGKSAVAKVADNANYPLGGMAIPAFGGAGRLPIAVHDAAESIEDASPIGANHDIGAVRYCHRAFGVVTERETWDTENSGLFLSAAGVGQHNRRGRLKIKELEIAQRLHGVDAVEVEAEILNAL